MTKLLFVVHDDVADAVPACKDAGGGGKGMGLLFSGVLVCSKNRAARCCFEHFQEEWADQHQAESKAAANGYSSSE